MGRELLICDYDLRFCDKMRINQSRVGKRLKSEGLIEVTIEEQCRFDAGCFD